MDMMLDVRKLQPLPMQLHLRILPANISEATISDTLNQITGFVQGSSVLDRTESLSPTRSVDEYLRCLGRVRDIASAHDRALNEQFSGATKGHQFLGVPRVHHPANPACREANIRGVILE